MKKQGTLRGLGLLAAILLLGGCGEDSNITQDDVGAVGECRSIPGASCVEGRFIDDAAVNVNYQCGIDGAGTVHSVTGGSGGFSCPNGSQATFSLTHPDKPELKIILGTVRVSKPAGVSTGADKLFFNVTPQDLAGDSSVTSPSLAAVNITRFLHSLSDDTLDADLPSYRVLISDATKRKITAADGTNIKFNLPTTLDPVPGEGTFEYAVKPFLQSLSPSRSLVSYADADEFLRKGVYSTMAGVYEAYDPTASGDRNTSGGLYGTGGGRYFIGALWNLVDRRGRTIGSGVYSYEPLSNTLLWSEPHAIAMKSTPNPADPSNPFFIWPYNGDLKDIAYDLVNDSGAQTGQVATITNGTMRRGAIAGNKLIYGSLFAETPTVSDLGRWSLATSSTTTPITGGALTLRHAAPAAPTMNPTLWRPDRIDFPIAVTVKLMNLNRSSPCTALGCEMASFRMTILRDGNIISDKHGRCGKELIPASSPAAYADINPETLKYDSDGAQEVPIGVVQNIQDDLKDENESSMEVMTMLVMIPNDPDFRGISPYLPYVQFGSAFGDYSLLRIDSSANRLRSYGKSNDAFTRDTALWRNNFTTAKSLDSSATQVEKDNVGGIIVSEPTVGCP